MTFWTFIIRSTIAAPSHDQSANRMAKASYAKNKACHSLNSTGCDFEFVLRFEGALETFNWMYIVYHRQMVYICIDSSTEHNAIQCFTLCFFQWHSMVYVQHFISMWNLFGWIALMLWLHSVSSSFFFFSFSGRCIWTCICFVSVRIQCCCTMNA